MNIDLFCQIYQNQIPAMYLSCEEKSNIQIKFHHVFRDQLQNSELNIAISRIQHQIWIMLGPISTDQSNTWT